MKTTLSPERLAQLLAEGRTEAARCRFVDPAAVATGTRLLRERGEEWAASVLMRTLDRRSLLRPDLPWLEPGELEALALADRAESDALLSRAVESGGEPC